MSAEVYKATDGRGRVWEVRFRLGAGPKYVVSCGGEFRVAFSTAGTAINFVDGQVAEVAARLPLEVAP